MSAERYGWKDIRLALVDGYDLQQMKLLEFELPKLVADVEDWHAAGEEWNEKESLGTKHVDGQVVLRVPLDTNADASAQAFVDEAHRVDGVVCIGLQGAVKGKKFMGFKAHQMDYAYEPQPDGRTKLVTSWDVNGELHHGVVLAELISFGADGDTTGASVDGSASSADGGIAFLQLADVVLDGADGVEVKVIHSTDDVAYADLVTFDAVTGERDGQVKEVTGTVNRYLAISIDFTGTPGGSASARVMVGFRRYPAAA